MPIEDGPFITAILTSAGLGFPPVQAGSITAHKTQMVIAIQIFFMTLRLLLLQNKSVVFLFILYYNHIKKSVANATETDF